MKWMVYGLTSAALRSASAAAAMATSSGSAACGCGRSMHASQEGH